METALEILARLGTDNAPSLEELTSARDTIARELHSQKGKGNSDLEALMSLRTAYDLASEAVKEAEAAEAKAAAEVDSVLDDIPDPDAELSVEPTEVEVAQVLSMDEALKRLGLKTATIEESAPTVEVREVDPLAQVTHEVRFGNDRKDDATWRDMAEAFAEASRSQRPGKERIARITSQFALDRTVNPGDTNENTRLVDSLMSPEAVVAAGGCCSLPTPIYENPVVGSLARPIRDSLPSLGVQSRGAVQFFPAICIADSGSDIWTCEDDAAVDPDDDSTWKECADAECDEIQTVNVDGIYACNTVGNFLARFATEQWEGHLKAVSVRQSRIAEAALFDKMRNAVTSSHTGLSYANTYLNVVNTVARATALMRQDQRLADVTFDLWLADWVKTAIAETNRLLRLSTGGDSVEGVEAQLASAFSNEGVRVTYSLDIDDLEDFQYDGALADYPSTASAVLAPSGYFSFLDGGQFDLGTEIRDHDLNRQNKLAAFAESFEGLLARGCNAKALDIPVECDLTLTCSS